jgi:hypothetical protein
VPITGAEIDALSNDYMAGAKRRGWRGRAVAAELSVLGVNYSLAGIRSHADLEDHILNHVAPSVRSRGAFTAAELLLVASWKSDRTVSCVAMNERIGAGTLAALTGAALAPALTSSRRVEALREIHGVGVRMASAILMFWDPAQYTVLDVRALRALGGYAESAAGTLFTAHSGEWWDGNYDLYCAGCRSIAAREQRDLRLLDRALWKRG